MYNTPITLEALLVLDAIDNRGSFAAAAEQLNKVPSALSYIVQKLEEQLSVTLFVRQGRRSVLTPAGRHLLEEGRKLLSAVSIISEQTQTIAHGWEPRIRVAIDSIFDLQQFTPAFKLFLDEHPNIEFDLSEEVMNGAWEALIEDRVDLVIGAPGPVPNQHGIRAVNIAQLEFILVAAKGHELTRFTTALHKSDIEQYRTVVVHDTAKNVVARSSNIIQRSKHIFVNSIEHKIKTIEAGIGVGFLPKQRIQSQLNNSQLVEIPLIENTPLTDIFIAWKIANKGKGLQRLQQIIINNDIAKE